MTIKELIERLDKFDKNAEFEVIGNDGIPHKIIEYGYDDFLIDNPRRKPKEYVTAKKVRFIFKEAENHESL